MNKYVLFVALGILLRVFDAATTYYGLVNGLGEETNPIILQMIKTLGLEPTLALSVVVTVPVFAGLAALYAWLEKRVKARIVKLAVDAAMAAILVVCAIPVVNNVCQIFPFWCPFEGWLFSPNTPLQFYALPCS